MTPDTSEWRRSTVYDFMDDVGVDDLAWECLRRNTDYQTDYASLRAAARLHDPLPPPLSARWGLRFCRETEPFRP
jgi:hypothetical protein